MSDILKDMMAETEYLETTDADIIPCISIEHAVGILLKHKLITQEQHDIAIQEV